MESYTVPCDTEMLFAEDGKSYWLVVKKEFLPKLEQEFMVRNSWSTKAKRPQVRLGIYESKLPIFQHDSAAEMHPRPWKIE